MQNIDQYVNQLKSGILAAPTQPSNALTDLDLFLRGLPPEERRAVEQAPQCQQAKALLYETFVAYMIFNTLEGQRFCGGAGLTYAQSLLDTARAVHKEVAGKLESEKESLVKRVESLEEINRNLLQQLGVTNDSSPT